MKTLEQQNIDFMERINIEQLVRGEIDSDTYIEMSVRINKVRNDIKDIIKQ